LEDKAYHPWVAFIFGIVRGLPYIQTLVYYRLYFLTKFLIPKKLSEAQAANDKLTIAKVERRVAKGVNEERGDFLSHILKHEDGQALSQAELHSMSTILIIGGSETTATLLSAATYNLLANPRTYRKLANEIRSSFQTEKDITLLSAGELKYMLAVLDESLRIFPPAPATFPRVVRDSGEAIDGKFVPGGTVVGVNIYASSHYSGNFSRPNSFIPERFYPETKDEKAMFASDDKAASQPFSLGPRNCIGRALAYAEMRLIMARLIWNFDLELAAGSEEWGTEQRAYLVWEKGPLMVKLTPVEGR